MSKKVIFSVAALFVSGFLLYLNTFDSTFHFDDYGFIVNNRSLREIGNLSGIWNTMGVPTRFVALYSFAINYQLHELNVVGYHVTNTLIHCITACLVFWFVRLLLSVPKMQDYLDNGARRAIPFLTALLFIVHPIQTQAVTYISQRFASLATLFYVASLCFYLKARLTTDALSKSNALLFLCFLFGLLGMFTKEIVITLPIMIILLEWFVFGGKFIRQHKMILISLLAMILIIPAMFSFQMKTMFLAARSSESHPGDIITFGPYLLTQLRVFLTFLKLFIFPVGLNLDYDFPLSYSLMEGEVLISVIVLFSIIVIACSLRKKNPLISLGIVWFFVTLSPNIVPRANLLFEHKMYLASIGLCIATVSGSYYFVNSGIWRRNILVGAIILLSVLTFQRNKIWHNDISLWGDVVEKSPNKFRPNLNLGKAYLDHGQYKQADTYFNRALELNGEKEKALNNLGLIATHYKDFEKAMEYYNQAIIENPNHPKTFLNRGALFRAIGKKELALKDYDRALELNPQYSIVYVNRGNIFASSRKFKEAIADYTKAIDDYVNYEEAYRNRGNAYRMLGKRELALVDYNKALEANPRSGAAYYYRSIVYYDLKNYDQARRDIKVALQLGYQVPAKYIKALNSMP